MSVQRAGLPEQALRRAKVQHCGADGTSNQGRAAVQRPGLVTECARALGDDAYDVPSQSAKGSNVQQVGWQVARNAIRPI